MTATAKLRPVILLPLLLLLAGGCASMPVVGDRAEEEIADLKRQLNEQKRNATVGEIEVARLRDELARAKTALRQAEDELARRRSDDSLRSDTPIKPPKRVDQTELEDEPIAPPPLSAPPAAPAGPPSGGGPKPSPFPADHAAAAVAPPGEDPQVLYDRGYTLFHQKSYDLAEATFRTFLTRHPESDLADNANFWIGESYFARGDYVNALTEFADTVDRFPQGNKVSDALFKAGRCLEEMGRLDEARDTYREVQERFAGSVAASGAKERLDALRAAAGKR